MSTSIPLIALQILLLAFGAAALLAVFWVASRALAILPMSRSRREALTRAAPLLGAFAALGYAIWAVRTLFSESFYSIGAALILAAFAAASWNAIRDVLSGVFIKAGRVCRVGDYVRIAGLQGKVERMGLRVLALETSQGDEAIIPYTEIAKKSVLRTPVLDTMALHVFKLTAPQTVSVTRLKTTIREAALTCHWSSLVRIPEVMATEEGSFEVTVFALDADHTAEIESSVRQAVAKLSTGQAKETPAKPTG